MYQWMQESVLRCMDLRETRLGIELTFLRAIKESSVFWTVTYFNDFRTCQKLKKNNKLDFIIKLLTVVMYVLNNYEFISVTCIMSPDVTIGEIPSSMRVPKMANNKTNCFKELLEGGIGKISTQLHTLMFYTHHCHTNPLTKMASLNKV